MDALLAEAAAEGVERRLAPELDMPVRDEIQGLAFLAETVGCEAVDHRDREAVEDLGHVDVPRAAARALPSQLAGGAAAQWRRARRETEPRDARNAIAL